MATFNTAFGSLPTPAQELFGNSATARKPKARNTGQIEQGTATGSTMNFAEMQKSGIARPAPAAMQTQQSPMLTLLNEQLQQPVAAPAPPQSSTAPDVPPMISALQTTLPQPTTAPVPAAAPASVAPEGGEPVPVGAPAAAKAPPTNTVVRNPDGSTTVTNPETPVVNPPTFKEGEPVSTTAPNGSTYTTANGVVWTKRAGLWVVEAGNDTLQGYDALIPPELKQLNNATGARSQSSDVRNWLINNGVPKTDAELKTVAANFGMTVDQLRGTINAGSQPGVKYPTQAQASDMAEWNQYVSTNGYTTPTGFSWIPARFRPAGQSSALVPQSSDLAKSYANYQQTGVFAVPSGDTTSSTTTTTTTGTPGTTGRVPFGPFTTGTTGGKASVAAVGAPRSGEYTTQQAGGASSFYVKPTTTYAIPNYSTLLGSLGSSLGTSAAPSAAAYAGSKQALDLRKQIEAQLGLLAAGSDTQKKAFEATRGARSAELTAQYGAERSKLEEDLAARGLSASTIGGGRYGDLAGQQARAMASFEADMLKQQSEAESRDRALYMATMSDLAGMAGTQDLGTYEANLKDKQIQSDIAFRAAELQQEAALKGRDLDLQQARDMATSQYQSGQLGLGYAEVQSREQMQREDQTFRGAESQLERDLRESLQGNEIASQERIAELDRDLRDKIASGELTLNQGIALGNIAQRIWDGSLDISYWDTAVISLGLDPKNFPRPPVNPYNKNSSFTPSTPETSGNPQRQENPPPQGTLSNYTPGTRFNIRGVIYTLDASGRLIDPAGRQYNYSNAE